MRLSQFLAQHTGKFACINDLGLVPEGEPNLDVLIWDTEAESENDDGQNAIARMACSGEQPALMLNGDVSEIDEDMIDEAREADDLHAQHRADAYDADSL
jgi:hypothetical protein